MRRPDLFWRTTVPFQAAKKHLPPLPPISEEHRRLIFSDKSVHLLLHGSIEGRKLSQYVKKLAFLGDAILKYHSTELLWGFDDLSLNVLSVKS